MRPYASTRSYIHHLSQCDANLALLSSSTVCVFPALCHWTAYVAVVPQLNEPLPASCLQSWWEGVCVCVCASVCVRWGRLGTGYGFSSSPGRLKRSHGEACQDILWIITQSWGVLPIARSRRALANSARGGTLTGSRGQSGVRCRLRGRSS